MVPSRPVISHPINGDTMVAHLDKSHVTVHTYPEYHPDTSLATFRVDIDVATCGKSPLCAPWII
jgi:S-adenosylmethionine decarboxylase